MSSVSNKYASKIFSEHPIAIWPLDENVSYVSMLNDAQRDFSDLFEWNLTNCSIIEPTNLPQDLSPFSGASQYFEIVGDETELSATNNSIEILSDFVISVNDIDNDLKTFSINFYLYQDSILASSYEFGISYYNVFLSQEIKIFKEISAEDSLKWIRFQETFDINEIDADDFRIFIKINTLPGGIENQYNFIIHGFSVGQWSETTSSKNIGVIPQALPESTQINQYVECFPAEQYGPLSDNAYYIIEDNLLLSKNDGVPIIFGSENSTSIYPSTNSYPSFILPSKGFLSKEGKNKTYTLEFWTRIRPNTKQIRKILGAYNSNDGIYVSEGFITLVIGNKFSSHNISEWYRPMLIHIIYSNTNAKLFLNGEEVIDLLLEDSDINFFENDWIGIYSYSDINIFEIDCISIFPYQIPLQVAKRRFVWGLGTLSQEAIDSSFSGFSTAISFPNANYSSNIVYPDKERWDAGYYNNLTATSSSLSIPEYSISNEMIQIGGRDLNLWYSANKKVNNIEYPESTEHPKFITFRPGLNEEETEWQRINPDWTQKSYLQFSANDVSIPALSAVYGVFEVEDDIEEVRPLIHFYNTLTKKRFEINISGYEISYSFDGTELYSQDTSGQQHVIVGIHIPTISNNYDLSAFFSPFGSLKIFVGGSPDEPPTIYETFEGKIYKIAFSDSTNFSEIESYFDENGFAKYDDDTFFQSHYSTYALMPFERYGKFFLDISISASWEQYYPLSYFAQYVYDATGSLRYLLDFLQFNIGYPSHTIKTIKTIQGSAWEDYSDLENFFAYPIEKNYEFIENFGFSGYTDYDSLNNNEISFIDIDESQSSLNIFATFQLISEGSNEPIENFIYTKELSNNLVIDASLENTVSDPYKAYKTKFRIIDGSIVYPPRNIKFDQLALVLYFKLNQDGILSKPLKIRDMEITSKALNASKPNAIGTKFSNNIYPYIKSDIYYDYKSKNPILINKRNTPYLYLTENTGIKVLTNNTISREYAIAIPINSNRQNNFYISAIQIFIKYDSNSLMSGTFPIFEIQSRNSFIEFIAEKQGSLNRYKIFARDKNTKQIYKNISFYQNGINVENPLITENKWFVISAIFDINSALDFSLFSGSINLFSGCHFDNISVYQSKGLNETSSVIPRLWQNVLSQDGINNLDWQYWYDENGTLTEKNKWEDVYVIGQEKEYLIDSSFIYSSYVGTNAEVVDDNEGIQIIDDDFIVFSEILWSNIVNKPA